MQSQPGPVDFGGLVGPLVNGFSEALAKFTDSLPEHVGTNLGTQLTEFWGNLALSGINFMVHTPVELVTIGSTVGTLDVRPLLSAVNDLALVLGAVSYAGHRWAGWPGMSQTVQRILVTVLLVSTNLRLSQLSLDVLNAMVDRVHAELPPLPGLTTFGNPLIGVVMVIPFLFMTLRLAVQMARRLIWMVTLYPLGPLAMVCWIHPKSAWITVLWTKLWVGWTFGQLIVVVSLALSLLVLGKVGGIPGYLLSLGALHVAYEAVHILAPKDGSISVSVGAGPARMSI